MRGWFDRRRLLIATGLMAAGAHAAPLPEGHAMLNAAELGDADAVARYIGIGAPLEARDANGRTALLLATRGNHIETARILIQAGADVNAADRIKDSPFLYAAAEGRLEILDMTLAHGANLASTNRYGGTALIPACHHGHIDIVYRLLKTKIDVNHVNHLGWTALLEAVILGDGGPIYIEIVEALLQAGADPRLADREGRTPLVLAKARDFHAIAALINRALAR